MWLIMMRRNSDKHARVVYRPEDYYILKGTCCGRSATHTQCGNITTTDFILLVSRANERTRTQRRSKALLAFSL